MGKPDMIFGGSGRNWFRFGNMWVNDSKEGWDSVERLWDYLLMTVLVIGGVICFFSGLILIGIILAVFGIWGFCSEKALNRISGFLTICIFGAIIAGIIVLLSL